MPEEYPPEPGAGPGTGAAAERIAELLRELAGGQADPRTVGEQAAQLWWRLDEDGGIDALPPGHEDALLQLAALHTGDRRLRRQALVPEEAAGLLDRLTRED